MPAFDRRDITGSDVLETLWRGRRRCAATVFLVLALTAAFIFLVPPTWMGSQAIMVRDDAAMSFGAHRHVGEDDAVKSTQETLQEIASSCSVLKSVLQRVGPTASRASTSPWPTDKAIGDLRDAVTLAPPKGMEFGKTAVFYLKVKDHDRDRAVQLTDGVYVELSKAFGQLRATVAESAIAELQASVSLAEANLAQATRREAQIEKEAGVDLIALRMLQQSPAGDASIYRTLATGMEELRQARAVQAQQASILAMLQKAEVNPHLLLAAPKELLECHPGLARLIEGLSESRLRSFASASKVTEEHPEMRARLGEEAGIREGIRQELATAIEGVTATRAFGAARLAALETQVDELNRRLARLTDMRAEYSNLVAQVEQRRTLVEESHRNLAQARAAYAAATTSSLLSRVDLPDGGLRPISPSRSMIGLAGLLGSLMAGCGVVLLTSQIGRREDQPLARTSHEKRASPSPAPRANGTRAERVVWTRDPDPALSGARDI